MTMTRTLGRALIAATFAALTALASASPSAMRQQVDAEIARLQMHAAAAPAIYSAALAALPAPVRRYLAYTGADRAPSARVARYRFTGEVRIPLTGDRARLTVRWRLAEGDFEQVRARIEAVQFNPEVPQP